MRRWDKRIAGLWVVLAACLWVSGCGNSQVWAAWSTDQVAIEKDGRIVYCVVDSFDKNFYNLDELTGMAVEEAAYFNGKNKSGNSTPVVVEEVAKVEEGDGLVRVVYHFDSDATYSAFLGEPLFYETLGQAVSAKRIFTGEVLFDAQGSISLDERTQEQLAGKHVIVTNSKTVFHPPYQVLYYSEGVKILGDGSVDTTACVDKAILILKK